jgi:hypothetical protein
MYVDVTHIVDEMPASLPGGIVRGRVRQEGDRLRICELGIVLDAMSSPTLSAIRPT